MRLVDYSYRTAAADLALDEALLDEAEQASEPRELLRLWEPDRPFVVVGRSSQVAVEVHESECQARDIAIYRRTSGGASIVTGPGCLMYAVVLSYELRPELRALDVAHRFVMETMRAAIAPQVPEVEHQGTCDLTWRGRKFSGNSVRCRRSHLLYHGTLLYDFPLELITACLGTPPRVPDYRADRPHGSFVTNLPVDSQRLRKSLINTWQADESVAELPHETVQQLVAEKYSQREWNHRL